VILTRRYTERINERRRKIIDQVANGIEKLKRDFVEDLDNNTIDRGCSPACRSMCLGALSTLQYTLKLDTYSPADPDDQYCANSIYQILQDISAWKIPEWYDKSTTGKPRRHACAYLHGPIFNTEQLCLMDVIFGGPDRDSDSNGDDDDDGDSDDRIIWSESRPCLSEESLKTMGLALSDFRKST